MSSTHSLDAEKGGKSSRECPTIPSLPSVVKPFVPLAVGPDIIAVADFEDPNIEEGTAVGTLGRLIC